MKVFTINENGGHLGHVTCTIYINFPTFQGGSIRNSALIGQAVSEKMFDSIGYIHVYSPGIGADNHTESNSFQYNSVSLVLCCKFSSIKNDFVTAFPIQTTYVQATQFGLAVQ